MDENSYIIIRIHARLENNERDIKELINKVHRHDSDIYYTKKDIKEIKSDTSFIRRTITAAIVTAAIGGAITLAYQLITSNLIGG